MVVLIVNHLKVVAAFFVDDDFRFELRLISFGWEIYILQGESSVYNARQITFKCLGIGNDRIIVEVALLQ